MNPVKKVFLQMAIGGMKAIYLPIKALPSRKKVTFLSRQADEPSIDIILLRDRIKEVYPDCEVAILSKKLTPSIGYALDIIRQMYHISTSRTVILDSYSIPISVLNHKKDLLVIQMWHAIGSMKCFGYAMIGKEEGSDAETARIMRMHHNYDVILISSKDFIKDYEIGFRMDPEIVKEIPLPRADLLVNKEGMSQRREKVLQEYPSFANKKTVLYCPTFRKSPSDLDREKVRELVEAFDRDKYNLIYKPHGLSKVNYQEYFDLILDDEIDAIALADYVISDYSSIIYEAGLAGKPIYLYAYDWDEYKDKRELNIDLQREVPTVFTHDPQEIVDAIESENYDWQGYENFIDKNARIPAMGCVNEILKLIRI